MQHLFTVLLLSSIPFPFHSTNSNNSSIGLEHVVYFFRTSLIVVYRSLCHITYNRSDPKLKLFQKLQCNKKHNFHYCYTLLFGSHIEFKLFNCKLLVINDSTFVNINTGDDSLWIFFQDKTKKKQNPKWTKSFIVRES